MKYAIGIDLGGTKILTGLINQKGEIVNKIKVLTEVEKGKKNVITKIINSIKDVYKKSKVKIKEKDIVGIAIGSPGPLNTKSGIIYFAPNLPGWKNVHLKDIIQQQIKFPVYIDNDANLAAYGENWIGCAKGVKYFLFITLGTGVGGGLVFNDEIYHGTDDAAAEIGHITIFPDGRKCNCGNYGCLETYSSAGGIVRNAEELIKKGEKTKLDLTQELTSEKIYKTALKSDRVSIKSLEFAGKCLGIGISVVCALLNLDVVAIGGNVAEAGDFIFKPAIDETKKRTFFPSNKVKIVKATLGTDAGMIGAAHLVFTNRLRA